MPDSEASRPLMQPVYEHPYVVRLCHWANAVTLTVMAMSGLQIFIAFPSFGPKIPQQNVVDSIPDVYRLGGWLGGALQWHFTFMWLFAAGGVLYAAGLLVSGHIRVVLFRLRDIPGVWPMIRHYFLSGPKPAATAPYNPLQKLAYTITLGCAVVSVVTGLAMFKTTQLSALASALGGYHNARWLHFLAMCGLLAFIPCHLIMVILHGWDNFQSMVTGWKQRPNYPPGRPL